jgi:hypothetical protein
MTGIKNTTGGEVVTEKLSRNQAMADAILARALPQSFKINDESKQYRSFTLIDMAREILGYNETRSLSKSEIAKRALSTSDFSEVLANVANKSLRKAYDDTRKSFTMLARQISLPDFKEAKRVALSNASSLDLVVEGGEYKYGTMTDGAETIALSTYGKIIKVTRETIINDDLDAISRTPQMHGNACARLVNRSVYRVLIANATMGDGQALFSASHAYTDPTPFFAYSVIFFWIERLSQFVLQFKLWRFDSLSICERPAFRCCVEIVKVWIVHAD